MSYFYQIYGLSIKSDIQFPELLTTLDFFSVDNTITISIKKNKPKPLKAPLSKGAFYQINAKTLLQYIPSIGYLSIRNGKTITIFPKMNIDEDSLREAVLNIGIKAILCQRNFFVMPGFV